MKLFFDDYMSSIYNAEGDFWDRRSFHLFLIKVIELDDFFAVFGP